MPSEKDPSLKITNLIKNPSFTENKETIDKIEKKYTMQNYEHAGNVKETEVAIAGLEQYIDATEVTVDQLKKRSEYLKRALISGERKDDDNFKKEQKEITESILENIKIVQKTRLEIEKLRLNITN